MTPENCGYHVEACEAIILPRGGSVASGPRLATANLSIARELLVCGGWFWAGRRFLYLRSWRRRHLPSGTASVGYSGLKQLANSCLIRIKQFIRPLQTLKSLGQCLDLLIMRLDFLLDRGDLITQPLVERVY